jgi:hypothetical protein
VLEELRIILVLETTEYSHSLVFAEDWFQDPLQTPKSVGAKSCYVVSMKCSLLPCIGGAVASWWDFGKRLNSVGSDLISILCIISIITSIIPWGACIKMTWLGDGEKQEVGLVGGSKSLGTYLLTISCILSPSFCHLSALR